MSDAITTADIVSRCRDTILAMTQAMNEYLPPDGIGKDEFISRVIGELDNPSINPVILIFEENSRGTD